MAHQGSVVGVNNDVPGLETTGKVRAVIGQRRVRELHGRVKRAPKSAITRARIAVGGGTREKNSQGGKGGKGRTESS